MVSSSSSRARLPSRSSSDASPSPRPGSTKWFVCARKPLRGSSRATPDGESSKTAPPPAASTTVTALDPLVGESAEQRRGIVDRRAELEQRAQDQVHRHAHGAAVAPVVEDVEADRETAARESELGQDAGLGHRHEPLAVGEVGRPDDAALGRVDVPVPVLREPRAVRGIEAREQRAASLARDLGAGVQGADQLGRHAGARGDPFHLLDHARLPVRDPRQGGVAETQHACRDRARGSSRTGSCTSAGRPRSARRASSPSPRRVRAVRPRPSGALQVGCRPRGRTIAIVRGWPTIPTAREPRFPGADPTSFASSASPNSESATSRGCPTPSRSCSRTCCAMPADSTSARPTSRPSRATPSTRPAAPPCRSSPRASCSRTSRASPPSSTSRPCAPRWRGRVATPRASIHWCRAIS